MPLDPVEQTLEQGRTHASGGGGSEGVGGFVQMALARRNMQQRQTEHADEVNLANQRLDIERRQQANRDQQAQEEGLLAPLIREHQAAVNKQTGATATGAVLDTQLKADQMEGLNGLSALQLRAIRSPNGVLDPALLADTQTLYSQHSGLLRTQEGAAFLRSIRDAQTVVDFTRKFGAPESASVTDSTTGATMKFGEPDTAQIKNAKEATRLDKVINDPNASDADIAAAQSERDLLTQQLRNTLPQTEQLQSSRDRAIQRGDFDSAHELDNQIAALAQKSAGRGFAPSAMGKKIQEWQQALLDGNPLVINYYERELGMSGMNATEKAQYRAGLAAINADPTMYKAADKQAAQEAFTQSFVAKHAGSKTAPEASPRTAAPTATPQTFIKGERERRTQNGHTFEFDGSKWNRVP